jgi:4-aminobutyrate aminotransferase-like enzyme
LPDIVTVGKLMGNGHLGDRGTIAPEVIEAFGKRIRYFNTFGGNPASCAVGPCGCEGHQGRPAAGADQRDGK